MKRDAFLATTSAAAALTFAGAAIARAAALTQAQIRAELPDARSGQWARYIMGFGEPFQQQVAFGIEETPIASRYFIETQIGMPGGSCNPNTVRKAYLKARRFGTLLDEYEVEAYVSKSGTLLMLDQPENSPLRLLDSAHLYTSAPGMVETRRTANARVPSRAAAFTEDAISVPFTMREVQHVAMRLDDRFLRAFEVWSAPHLPLGIARVRADVHGMPPFELHLDSFGHDFKTQIAESLDAVRAQQS